MKNINNDIYKGLITIQNEFDIKYDRRFYVPTLNRIIARELGFNSEYTEFLIIEQYKSSRRNYMLCNDSRFRQQIGYGIFSMENRLPALRHVR